MVKKKMLIKKYDFIFNSNILYKIFLKLMRNGSKTTIQNIIYLILNQIIFIKYFKIFRVCIKIILFFEIILRLIIYVNFKIFRKNKNKFINKKIIPIKLFKSFRYIIALNWFINALKKRQEKKIFWKMYFEIFDIIFKNKGFSLTQKKKFQLLLIKNRGNITYKW